LLLPAFVANYSLVGAANAVSCTPLARRLHIGCSGNCPEPEGWLKVGP
jgi:hypothetical protein